MTNTLYQELFEKYKLLTPEKKKEKLLSIIDNLWDKFALGKETKELLTEEISDQYLNDIYEAIMLPYCETYEKNKEEINSKTSQRMNDLKERMIKEQEKSQQEAESLLEQINVF